LNPDLASGRSISYEAHFKHALIQMETGRKTADSPVLRDKPAIRPETFSDGKWTVLEFREKYFPRHETRLWEGINKA
jgi:hypothetical protein